LDDKNNHDSKSRDQWKTLQGSYHLTLLYFVGRIETILILAWYLYINLTIIHIKYFYLTFVIYCSSNPHKILLSTSLICRTMKWNSTVSDNNFFYFSLYVAVEGSVRKLENLISFVTPLSFGTLEIYIDKFVRLWMTSSKIH